jgi:hypothetical protein
MNELIGLTAGKIWNYLNKNGVSNVVKMKIELKINNIQLFLALGWLLREDKIVITQEKNNMYVKLKEEK